MRVIFPFILLIFAFWPSSHSMSGDDSHSCSLEPEEGFIWRLLNPPAVSFRQNGKLVAEGTIRNHRTGRVIYGWSAIPETWNGTHRVDFEIEKDGDGILNYVYFSFVNAVANGTIVLRTKQNKTALSLYFVDGINGEKSLSLIYFESIAAATVFNDLSCLMDSGQLAE